MEKGVALGWWWWSGGESWRRMQDRWFRSKQAYGMAIVCSIPEGRTHNLSISNRTHLGAERAKTIIPSTSRQQPHLGSCRHIDGEPCRRRHSCRQLCIHSRCRRRGTSFHTVRPCSCPPPVLNKASATRTQNNKMNRLDYNHLEIKCPQVRSEELFYANNVVKT